MDPPDNACMTSIMEFCSDRVAQTVTVVHQFPVNKNHHVLADSALLVQDVAPRSLVITKIVIEHGT